LNFFIIKIEKYIDLKKKFFTSEKQLKQFSNILFLISESQKIYGGFQVVRVKKENNIYRLYHENRLKLRRGVPLKSIKNILHLKLSSQKVTKIEKKTFVKILQMLNKINFPQLASDILYIDMNNNNLNIRYLKNYTEIQIVRESISVDKKILDNDTERFVNIIKNKSDIALIKNMGFKLFKLFSKSNIFSKNILYNRYIIITSNSSMVTKIPFELIYDGANFFIEKISLGRGIYLDSLPYEAFNLNQKSNITILLPKYKNIHFTAKKISALFANKNLNYTIYNKKLKTQEFVHICENSKILYFGGHSIFDKTRKDYGLKLSDSDIFYLQDFQLCSSLPEFIIFHACFENKFFQYIEKKLHLLFKNGTKNILMPFMEIPIESDSFIQFFMKKLLAGHPIGDAFEYSAINGIKTNQHDWKFFRLYGDPKLKYF